MEENKQFIAGLIGKKIVIKTSGGLGIKDVVVTEGEYKGTLKGFDGRFIQLEYDIRKFVNGATAFDQDIIFVNVDYIITFEEYKNKKSSEVNFNATTS